MNPSVRIIPKLDIKGPNLVKGIYLEGLRVLGKPEDFAEYYYKEGAENIRYISEKINKDHTNTVSLASVLNYKFIKNNKSKLKFEKEGNIKFLKAVRFIQ